MYTYKFIRFEKKKPHESVVVGTLLNVGVTLKRSDVLSDGGAQREQTCCSCSVFVGQT